MNKKILIVEDDVSFYNLCSIQLKLRGYEVYQVTDGSLAIDKIKSLNPDLVLLDVVLPGRNGLDILDELKTLDETKNIKVIVLTNFGTEENVGKSLELGAEDYIMKYNIVPSELADRVAALLGVAEAEVAK